ncbi:hypothetical protein D1BOALGB6SA_5696 [Olavius sp. associated proteobacterium Delta 1]|nr:hypothetical protein D1BOALGB6SA_5696 [Olavius sp. associated proteobacterium Delta 1]
MSLKFTDSVLLDIQHQVSSICPEKATISDITARLDDKNLCHVRVYLPSYTKLSTRPGAGAVLGRVSLNLLFCRFVPGLELNNGQSSDLHEWPDIALIC